MFSDSPAHAIGDDAETAGFYEREMPYGFRWLKREAVCRYPAGGVAAMKEPCLILRALIPPGAAARYVAISLDGRSLPPQLVSGYGTYFFPLPAGGGPPRGRETFEIRVSSSFEDGAPVPGDPRELAIAVYDLRVIDLASEPFPERAEFLDQLKVFASDGLASSILRRHRFRSSERILDAGAGSGWSTVLLAAFTGAPVWGVDLWDYSNPGRLSFRAELKARFERQRSVLRNDPRFSVLAEPAALEETLGQCTFVSSNAEETLFRDDAFDFAFSLNTFEHFSRPDRVLAEIRRVLRPGGHALFLFSPLFYSDAGSHLPGCLGFNKPWSHLLMTREAIKEAIQSTGGVVNEVDAILDSLNGWTPGRFIELFEGSGLTVIDREISRGFTLAGSSDSPEFAELSKRYPEMDLTTTGMLWHLEKRVER